MDNADKGGSHRVISLGTLHSPPFRWPVNFRPPLPLVTKTIRKHLASSEALDWVRRHRKEVQSCAALRAQFSSRSAWRRSGHDLHSIRGDSPLVAGSSRLALLVQSLLNHLRLQYHTTASRHP